MIDPISNLVASVAGTRAAVTRRASEAAKRQADKPKRARDEADGFDDQIRATEAADKTRSLADADQEDAREDRQEHAPAYRPDGLPRPDEGGQLDLNA